MPKEFRRSDRVADAIQRELAELIRSEIRDPRVGMVNLNAVKVANDLSTAKVYLTFVDNPKNSPVEERIEALNKASGFLRSLVGNEIQMRTVPRFHFIHDETVYRAESISKLIDQALESDALNHEKHHHEPTEQKGSDQKPSAPKSFDQKPSEE